MRKHTGERTPETAAARDEQIRQRREWEAWKQRILATQPPGAELLNVFAEFPFIAEWAFNHCDPEGTHPADCRQCHNMVRELGPQPPGWAILRAIDAIDEMHKGPKHVPTPLELRRKEANRKVKLARERVLERDGHVCRVCGTADDLTIDHIVPITADGDDEDANLLTLCYNCNARKGTRPFDRQLSLLTTGRAFVAAQDGAL